ncbi:MAG: type II toxin-antitoxin system VapB family antitoxin [Chloroflexia bacterium]|nr:type II toxin-antitoxin system VapB family antitoxin [Chloroflexia bacterium]
MALQIESPETIRVIHELARRTGQSEERVVDAAVRERLARLRTPEEEAERRAKLQATIDSLAARFKASGLPAVDPGDLFYDENGLPREGDLSEYEIRFYFQERYTLPEGMDGGEAWRSRSKHPKPSN